MINSKVTDYPRTQLHDVFGCKPFVCYGGNENRNCQLVFNKQYLVVFSLCTKEVKEGQSRLAIKVNIAFVHELMQEYFNHFSSPMLHQRWIGHSANEIFLR